MIFPKYRGDLVACAAITRAMYEGKVEAVHYPRNPLDVLAQQIVAMVAMDAVETRRTCSATVRQAAPLRGADAGDVFESVLDMLSGRYPSDEFAELRPRVTWDRVANRLTARQGARQRGGDQRRHDSGSRAVRRVSGGRDEGVRASANWTRRWCSRAAPATPSFWALPRGGSKRSRMTA